MELKDKFLELKEGHAQKLLNVESVLKAENVQLREQLIHLEQKVQEIINYKQSEIAKPIGNSKRQEKERESTIQKQEKADRSGKRKSYESVDNIESEHIHRKLNIFLHICALYLLQNLQKKQRKCHEFKCPHQQCHPLDRIATIAVV
jgi:hypothetical protein